MGRKYGSSGENKEDDNRERSENFIFEHKKQENEDNDALSHGNGPISVPTSQANSSQDASPSPLSEIGMSFTSQTLRRRQSNFSNIPNPDPRPDPTLYHHLISEVISNEIGTYYECKEHPEHWDSNLTGLIVSHIIPVHGHREEEAEPN